MTGGIGPVAMTLLPDAAIIAVGAVVGSRIASAGWGAVDRLNYLVLFPALLFTAAASRPIAISQLATIGVGVWAIMLVGLLLAWPLRQVGPSSFLDFAGTWQTAWRFNTGVAFVAAQALPPETAALMSVAVGLAVPMANVFAVTALSYGTSASGWRAARSVATNPFLLASLAGVVVGMSGLQVPDAPMRTLDKLADAAIPLALLSIGASISWRALIAMNAFTGGLNAIKLLALPCVALGIGYAFKLDGSTTAVLTVFAALPTASAAHVLAGAFGADRTLPSTVIAQSTLLACATLPTWIAILT